MSYKTAISRSKLPKPTQFLFNKGLIKGKVLDYGCGKCHDLNNQLFECDGYDPHFRPLGINGQYDTIICNYVLNVIEDLFIRDSVVDAIKLLLRPGGKAYISVRRDLKALQRTTKSGTWQGFIMLDEKQFHLEKGAYVMYLIESEE